MRIIEFNKILSLNSFSDSGWLQSHNVLLEKTVLVEVYGHIEEVNNPYKLIQLCK